MPAIGINVGKARQVREMFVRIAPSYDLLNHLLSFNIDKLWRRRVVELLRDVLDRPSAEALDVCCGTADLAVELGRQVPTVGVDFCHQMLLIGNKKVLQSNSFVYLLEADALSLPFADESFDAVTCAFGLRNLADIKIGLQEIYRVMRREGRAAILEFSQPVIPGFRQLFKFYFHHVLPLIGGAISGSLAAYKYLPSSVEEFPDQECLAEIMRRMGYQNVRYENLTGGVAAIHLGEKR
ncbi:MAG: bifunctional demethylmenaquinone methyltransferase/2-methoxy-6-polyprenyl-1,4-benzoquinol methylase UbiE [Acidobacteriota bacterium]|nr:bifunctional demethylmenaquinone methyltransferase/2-methoxy-6-polyprenyl-1,4-benzoquinol methylase UbiE [Blastocatellia bacterium]MDW8413637.1 bifunctional demethylmenaquinone methyltransferase/2-methoxy-6-polyprenyl-1,4-benzoquinol methylase UbiE [Acidobacteriota bacterium]